MYIKAYEEKLKNNKVRVKNKFVNRERMIKVIIIAIILGCLIGVIFGVNAPTISYTYSGYLAIAIIAALDSVFGGITSTLKGNFDFKVFVSGFFGNSILSILLTYLGDKLNVDIYLAAIFVFVNRMFLNLTIIRKYYIEKFTKKSKKLTNGNR
jgi:small basic protein